MRSPETRYAARPVAAVLLVVLAVVLAFSAVMNVPGASADPIGGDPRCTQTIKSGALEWDLSKYLAAFATGDRPTTWRNGSGEVGDDGSVDASFEGTSVHFDEESGAWLKITDPVVTLDGSGAGALRAEVAYGIAGQDEDGIVEFDPEQEPLRTATVEVITVKGQVVVKDRTMTADELTAQWSDAFLDLLKGEPDGTPATPAFPHVDQVDDTANGRPSPVSVAAVLSTLPEECASTAPPTDTPSKEPTDEPKPTAVEVDDAVFRWGLNRTSNAMSHSGAYNFFSAGTIRLSEANMLVPKKLWSAKQGNVVIQKWMGSKDGWQEAVWNGWKKNHKGQTNTTTGNFSIHNVVINGGEGWVDRKERRAEIKWTGTFTVVYYGGNSIFTVTDPRLSVTGKKGQITATLGGFGSAQGTSQWEELDPTEVTIADLSKVKLGKKGFTVTPDYQGVAVDITDEFPNLDKQTTGKDKGSFPPSMVRFLARVGVGPYWYSSALSSGNSYKRPLPLTISFDSSDEVDQTAQDDDDSSPVIENPLNDPPAERATTESQVAAPVPAALAPGLPAQVPESQRQLLTPADLGAIKPAATTTTHSQPDRTWWLVGSLLLVAALLLFIPARSRT